MFLIKQLLKHILKIIEHKRYVFTECCKVWLYWQWVVHDMSKFSITELFESAKYFQWDHSPLDKWREEQWYSIARLNHKGKNKHHFHYRIDIDRWKIIPVPMPKKYVLEMCCDMIWAWKAYNKKNFDRHEPIKYWVEKINKDFIHPDTVALTSQLLTKYSETWRLI